MVYGTCNYSIHGAYKQLITGGPTLYELSYTNHVWAQTVPGVFFQKNKCFSAFCAPMFHHVSPKTSSSTASFGCFEPVARSTSPNVSRGTGGTGGTVSASSRSPGRSPLALALAFCPTDPTGSSEKGHFESGSMKIYNSLTWNSVILCYIEIIHDNSLYTDHHLLGGCSEVVLIYPE